MDELKPGRELDILVAKQVMGCNVLVSRGVRDDDVSVHCGCSENHPHESAPGTMHYSTEIAAAWQVVEFLRHLSIKWSISSNFDQKNFIAHFQNADGMGSTAPLAICKAALQAMAVKQ